MYLPLDIQNKNDYEIERPTVKEHTNATYDDSNDIAEKLKSLLIQAGIPQIDEKLLLKGLLGNNRRQAEVNDPVQDNNRNNNENLSEFIQSENDFIDAYNALTRLSPLPNLNENNLETKGDLQQITRMKESLPSNKIISYESSSADDGHHRKAKKISASKESAKKITSPDNSKRNEVDTLNKNNENLLNKEHFSKTTEINPQNIKYFKTEEPDKTKNLNDIVDNTQKLIQQMKKEIHSDIHSLQDKSSSQSEAGDSSNESHLSSEKESSYSSSEDESKDLTSDEKHVTCSGEENLTEHIEKNETRVSINRTSSEDNEHFEEAMDHVENVIEDFKDTNIETLNSIAKGLQQEHILSVEINESRESNKRSQDVNNNLFAAVDSFEEIYQQLSNNGVQKQRTELELQKKTTKSFTLINNKFERAETIQPKPNRASVYIKEDIITSEFRPRSPIKLIIIENEHQFLRALLENFEESVDQIHPVEDNQVNEISDELSTDYKDPLTINALQQNNSNIISGITPTNLSITFDEIEDKTVQNDSDEELPNKEEREGDIVLNLTNLASNYEKNSSDQSSTPKLHIREPSHAENAETTQIDTSKAKITSIINKSNIPKLVRNMHGGKQKVDKNVTKVIASKVPVRRASLKQYPAPNPPKSRFAHVQGGFVKQLQNRLFSTKPSKSSTDTTVQKSNTQDQNVAKEKPIQKGVDPKIVEVKASTSTMTKKKQAPQPLSQTSNELSIPKTQSGKEKNKNYFRETCRTEDEWTESDGEDQNKQVNKEQESNPALPSPPQPITIRQVSGQLIDLALVKLPEGSPEVIIVSEKSHYSIKYEK